MAMAKSSRRKKQDRAKAEARRAQQSRLRARTESQQQLAERYSRLLDPRTSPAKVAGLLAAELAGIQPAGESDGPVKRAGRTCPLMPTRGHRGTS
jgi:hypothetical protein